MNPEPVDRGAPEDDEIVFRTLAAPGLDEDELFAAMYGLPGAGVLWGDGMPSAFAPAEEAWDADVARRRRHDELLRKWRPSGFGPPLP